MLSSRAQLNKITETIIGAAIHEAQTLSYLRLSGCRLALLINFNVTVLKDGIRRFINGTI